MGAPLATDVEDAGTPGHDRARTLTVIGTMALIAVVAVTAVVVWARVGAPDAGDRTVTAGVDEALPETLAGGFEPAPVPPEIVAAVDAPVVGAAKLEQLPDDMLAACMDFNEVTWDPGSPTTEYAVVTPDGVNASLFGQGEVAGGIGKGPEGEDPIGIRIRCELDLRGSGPSNRGGGGYEEVFPDQPVMGGFSGSSCCDEDGLATAMASVNIPDGAAWLLQQRGAWFLAYPVEGLDVISVTWRYRENRFGPGGPPQSRVVIVDGAGETIAESFVGGRF
jgi:hypothetical protein